MFHILYLRELVTVMSALWLEKEGRREEEGGQGEREMKRDRGKRKGGIDTQTDRQRLTSMVQKVKCQGACQGVTHAPQGYMMQGLLPPSHSCLFSGIDDWAGVWQNFIFMSPLLTVKTTR